MKYILKIIFSTKYHVLVSCCDTDDTVRHRWPPLSAMADNLLFNSSQ